MTSLKRPLGGPKNAPGTLALDRCCMSVAGMIEVVEGCQTARKGVTRRLSGSGGGLWATQAVQCVVTMPHWQHAARAAAPVTPR